MQHLELTEHERHPCAIPLTQEQRKALSNAHISVSASQSAEATYELTPSSYVGTVNAGSLSVVVRPKIKTDRAIFLILYAMQPEWRTDPIALAGADDVLEAVALTFALRTRQAIERGLLRGYRREEETLYTVRGQIRFSDQIGRRFDLPLPIEVTYDEYTEDIEQNRLLKTALHRLSLTRIRNREIANQIRSLRPSFDMVQLGQYARGAVPTIRYTRLDEHYRPAVELARLIIENTTLDLSTGSASGASFLVDMNVVFEKFVYVALREALGLDEKRWRQGEDLTLDEGQRIKIRPDLSWWPSADSKVSTSRPCFVGDAKYKQLDELSYRNQRRLNFRHADIYQMLAYCLATGRPSGLLIYAAEEKVPATEYTIQNSQTRIEVTSLDLSGSPSEILGEVEQLAKKVRDHARRSASQVVMGRCCRIAAPA